MQDVAPYRITGLVDVFDDQNNITGQYPVGSVQTLSVEFGDKQVEAGLAERLDADEAVAPADADEVAPAVDEADVEDPEAVDEASDLLPDEDDLSDTGADDVE